MRVNSSECDGWIHVDGQLTITLCVRIAGSLTADIVNGARSLEHLYVNSNKMSGNLAGFAKAADLSRLRKLRLE